MNRGDLKSRSGYISLYDEDLKEEIDAVAKKLITSGQMSRAGARSELCRRLLRLGLSCVWSCGGPDTGGLPSPRAIEEDLEMANRAKGWPGAMSAAPATTKLDEEN